MIGHSIVISNNHPFQSFHVSPAQLHPISFTKTVNKGDSGVILEVFRANGDVTDETLVRWWFTHVSPSTGLVHNGTLVHSGSFTYAIPGEVSTTDGGVYEVYYEGLRETLRHAIMRLIVRGNNIDDCNSIDSIERT